MCPYIDKCPNATGWCSLKQKPDEDCFNRLLSRYLYDREQWRKDLGR